MFAMRVANLREVHLDGFLNGRFHLGGRAEIKFMLHNKGKQNKKTRILQEEICCECEYQPLCTDHSQTLKKTPPGTVIDLTSPQRSQTKAEK